MEKCDTLHSPLAALALRDVDIESLERSASGGAFPVMARAVIRAGGVVFGSMCDSCGNVKTIAVCEIDDLVKLQGSKYVQNAVCDSFEECAKYLKDGRLVLFSGLPCQIAALKRSLAKAGVDCSERLYTCDLICHGVVPQFMFRLYIRYLEEKHDAVPGSIEYRFRSKRYGWGLSYSYSYSYLNKRGQRRVRYGLADTDPYYRAFLSGKYFNDGCYRCSFANPDRVGDFTIGDFWGIETEHPCFYSDKGVSAMLINTEKGMRFFERRMREECEFIESSFDRMAAHNVNLRRPSVRSEKDAAQAKIVFEAARKGDALLVFDSLLKERGAKGALKRVLPSSALVGIRALKRKWNK